MKEKENKKISSVFDKRPWGHEVWFPNEGLIMAKILTVEVGGMTSLQYHHHRDEFWRFISGNGSIVFGEENIKVKAGDELFIPREKIHRIIGGTEPLVFVELQYGKFDENDIVRLDDKYGGKRNEFWKK